MRKGHDDFWSFKRVLGGLKGLAIKAGVDRPIMLLLIDEPNKKNGASVVLSSLKGNALNSNWDVDCRVVMSALEQQWFFAERTEPGRPIYPLRLNPPEDGAVTGALDKGLSQGYRPQLT